jgi:hypothetical protein
MYGPEKQSTCSIFVPIFVKLALSDKLAKKSDVNNQSEEEDVRYWISANQKAGFTPRL